MGTFIIILTLLVFLVTVLPLSKHPHWSVRGFDFPRFQFACLAFAGIILTCLFNDSNLSGLCLVINFACFIWQASWIVPYTPLWKKEVKTTHKEGQARLKIITANVLKTNRQTDKLIELTQSKQADILVVLESDLWWESHLDVLSEQLPFSIKCPLDNLYGMHVYSRYPLEKSQICYFIEQDVPSMHTLIRLPSGDKVRAHFMHPKPPSPTENPESTERDAELVMVAKSVAKTKYPVIVTGDLNDVAWSQTTRLFRKISGLLDPRVGRGMFNTFHAQWPLLRWPLDHVFHSKHFTLTDIECLPDIGSDHFALYSELEFHRQPDLEQEGIELEDEEEFEWAEQIIQSKGANVGDVPKFNES